MELWGAKHILHLVDALEKLTEWKTVDAKQALKHMWLGWMPPEVGELALAWCADIEKVMG